MSITLSIETDAGTYQHGFHLGTFEPLARKIAEDIFETYTPRIGTCICTVALMRDGRLLDTFDGEWLCDILDRFYASEGE